MLSVKDYEEMRQIIQNSILKSKEEISKTNPNEGVDEAVEKLKETFKLLLQRPNTDQVLSSLTLMLQNEITNYQPFITVFKDVVEETLSAIPARNLSEQVSLIYIIENSNTLLKGINKPESTKALQKIADANIEISREVANYYILEMHRGKPISPSHIAQDILKNRKPAQEQIQSSNPQKKERKPTNQRVKNKSQNVLLNLIKRWFGEKQKPEETSKNQDTSS